MRHFLQCARCQLGEQGAWWTSPPPGGLDCQAGVESLMLRTRSQRGQLTIGAIVPVSPCGAHSDTLVSMQGADCSSTLATFVPAHSTHEKCPDCSRLVPCSLLPVCSSFPSLLPDCYNLVTHPPLPFVSLARLTQEFVSLTRLPQGHVPALWAAAARSCVPASLSVRSMRQRDHRVDAATGGYVRVDQ